MFKEGSVIKLRMSDNIIKNSYENSLETSYISNDLYEKYNVKKGLRNANGTGVLVLLTKISDVHGYQIIDGKRLMMMVIFFIEAMIFLICLNKKKAGMVLKRFVI